MHFTEAQTVEVKSWVIKRLEDISDADSDVLADYVLALLRSDASDDEIRKNSVENLEDFLKENTQKFVDDLFAKYALKTTPTTARRLSSPPISPVYSPSESALQIQAYQPIRQVDQPGAGYLGFNQSRKRSFHDSNGYHSEQLYGNAARPPKAPRTRKGGRDGRDDRFLGRASFPQTISQPTPFLQPFGNLPVPPTPPPGFPPLDLNDPMASFLAMQAMFPPTAVAATPLSISIGTSPVPLPRARKKQRCQDYDTKGFCILGSACSYEHGTDHIVAPADNNEYDPNNAVIKTESSNGRAMPSLLGVSDKGGVRNRTVDRGALAPRRQNRAPFSDSRLPDDRSITTIVVEQIPEENFEEEAVRTFFAQFGNILEITMKAYKHLAIVKYQTRQAAKRAWESPKVIFDNRFVKVYWYRPELDDQKNGTANPKPSKSNNAAATATGGSVSAPDTVIDEASLEAIKRQQEVKQKAHEERKLALQKTEVTKQALLRQKEDMARKHNEEKSALLAKIAIREGSRSNLNGALPSAARVDDGSSGTVNGGITKTQALRDQLAQLEAEAKSMGIDPDAAPDEAVSSYYGYRARGSGRGYIPRGRGFAPRGQGHFGGYESVRVAYSGSSFTRGRGSAVRKLDNRPRKVAVSGVDFDAPKTEMLRLYLTGLAEYEGVEPNPDKTNSIIVSFRERWMAEQLMNGKTNIPGVGKVILSWVANSGGPVLAAPVVSAPLIENEPATLLGDDLMTEPFDGTDQNNNGHDNGGHQEIMREEENLDVAGDDDWDNI